MRGEQHRLGARAVALAVGVALLASCAASGGETSSTLPQSDVTAAPAGPPQPGGTLRVGLSAETNSFSPITGQWAGQGYQVGRAIFDPLAAYGTDGKLYPYLAEAFEPNRDFTEWTIRLRPNVRFHDGTPFDGAALKANLEAQIAAPITGQVLQPIDRVQVQDDRTVIVSSRQSWSTFADYLTSQLGYMVAPATLQDPAGGDHPIGTGPFRFESWVRDQSLVVSRNTDYWRPGLPYLDGIEYRVIADPAGQVSSFISGDLDVAEAAGPSSIARLSEEATSGNAQYLSDRRETGNVITVAFNTAVPPFDDLDARRAVAYAVDNDALSQQLFEGLYPATRTLLAPSSPATGPTDYPPFDPAKAKELAQAYEQRTGQPLSFTLLVPSEGEGTRVAQFAQKNLSDVGITMDVKTVEQTTLLTSVLLGQYQATAWLLFGDLSFETNNVFIHGENVRPVGELSLAFTRLKDPTIDSSLDKLRTTADVNGQAEASRTINNQLGKLVPFIYVVRASGAIAVKNDVHGMDAPTFPDGRAAIPIEGLNLWFTAMWLKR